MLPTEKNEPGQTPLNKKFLLYAEPKVGKSTLVSKLFPNAAVFGTDPTGLEELEVFKVDVRNWNEFRRAAGELATYLEANPPGSEGCLYDAISVDTVDELSRFCTDEVLSQLPGGPDAKTFKHASDWEYGKAWNAISEEFRVRVAKLCNLGLPVVFVSHAKTRTIQKKTRTGQKYEVTVVSPDIGSGGLRDWLLKFVDYIFYAEVIHDDGAENRVIRTTPSESYLAGARQPEGRPALPETLPLDGARLRAALLATSAPGANDVHNPDIELEHPPEESAAEIQDRLSKGVTLAQQTNGKAKEAEPKKVQDARKILNAIPAEKVAKGEYTPREEKAMNTVSEYQAKQREAASA